MANIIPHDFTLRSMELPFKERDMKKAQNNQLVTRLINNNGIVNKLGCR